MISLRLMVCEFANALYLDVAYILDSIWRRAEYNVNRWFRYCVTPGPAGGVSVRMTARPSSHLPQFWLFAAVMIFVAYGPTLDSLCSVLGAGGMEYARFTLSVALGAMAVVLLVLLTRYGTTRANKRFFKAKLGPQDAMRRGMVRTVVELGVLALLLPLVLFAVSLWHQATAPVCHNVASHKPAILQLLVIILALAVAAWTALPAEAMQGRYRPLRDFVLLVVLALVLWLWVAAPAPSEATQTPYPHVYAVFALAIAAIAASAPFWVRFLFGAIIAADRAAFQTALRQTELFPDSRIDPNLSGRRIVAATITGICYHLLQVLLLPSLFLLIVPSHYVTLTITLGLVASIGLLTIGSLTTRWQQMVLYVRRWFLAGTPLITSLCVIALAVLRVLHVQYVTTVLDAAPFGVIFVWVVMNYVLFWWFEFAINSAAASELLRLLGDDANAAAGRVPYVPDPGTRTTMPRDNRWIAPHGFGRFVALGWCPDKDSKQPIEVFQAFDFMELFSRLTPPSDVDRQHELKRQLQLYFISLNAALAACLIAFLFYYGHGDRANTVEAVVTAQRAEPTDAQADLKVLLSRQAYDHRPAIIVAASGGGTRAALFTASALQGLAKLGVSRDVVLLSGVSGGGVATAYFYAHQAELEAPFPSSSHAWTDFEYRMTAPFIGDVLEGAFEWRVVSHAALGVLLKESFERQLFTSSGLQHLGDAAGPALILNTTVTGHPLEDSDLLRGMFLQPGSGKPTCDALHTPYANVSGDRLIFTNLNDRDAFPKAGGELATRSGISLAIPDVRLPYVVVQDPRVPLAAAAALNANFPPVFTNARVTVPSEISDQQCPQRSYYVTDGGATENLGLVSALYALRKALKDMSAAQVAAIPEIHLVLIEASATTYDYTPDRGINAATGGSKERLTGGLSEELLAEISGILAGAKPTAPAIRIHYLAMPLAFRSRGGFGTHWMFPDSISIENPRTAHPVPSYEWLEFWDTPHQQATQTLDRDQLITLWEQLHDPAVPFCGTGPFKVARDAAMRVVANWVCGRMESESLPQDIHIGQWQDLVHALEHK